MVSKVNDPNITFEALADSEKDRLNNLDMMLSNILRATIGRAGELGRLDATKAQSMHRAGSLTTGRQISHILRMRLRATDKMAMV